jgi:CRP-like cAMP-binding protein
MDPARIAALTLFAGLPDEELDAIAAVASEQEFATGQALMSEREFGYSLFVIESGSADVSINGEPVRTIGPGDVVGEIAVLAAAVRTASVIASSPLKAIALFKRDVWSLERTAPEAASRLRAAIDEHPRAAG